MFEVGRTGTLGEEFDEVDDGVVEAEVAGHTTGPQARSVGQHPPPRLEGQDRKPGEQERAVGGLEEESAVDDVSGEVEETAADEGKVEDDDDDDDGGGGDDDTVIVGVTRITGDRVCVCSSVLLGGEAVATGITTTVAVEIMAPREICVSKIQALTRE
ncbi:hypothetical protein MMC31_008094 [Peltigera leucophlebia]|nr:hypothetical protein [Peltigera leucophlebia]